LRSPRSFDVVTCTSIPNVHSSSDSPAPFPGAPAPGGPTPPLPLVHFSFRKCKMPLFRMEAAAWWYLGIFVRLTLVCGRVPLVHFSFRKCKMPLFRMGAGVWWYLGIFVRLTLVCGRVPLVHFSFRKCKMPLFRLEACGWWYLRHFVRLFFFLTSPVSQMPLRGCVIEYNLRSELGVSISPASGAGPPTCW